MAKTGLSNNLLTKVVEPKAEYGDYRIAGDTNGRIWAGLKPNASGEMLAIIDAAWTEEGSIKLAVHDVHGNTSEMYYKNVNLKG